MHKLKGRRPWQEYGAPTSPRSLEEPAPVSAFVYARCAFVNVGRTLRVHLAASRGATGRASRRAARADRVFVFTACTFAGAYLAVHVLASIVGWQVAAIAFAALAAVLFVFCELQAAGARAGRR